MNPASNLNLQFATPPLRRLGRERSFEALAAFV